MEIEDLPIGGISTFPSGENWDLSQKQNGSKLGFGFLIYGIYNCNNRFFLGGNTCSSTNLVQGALLFFGDWAI